jgi:hypothetical protein
MFLPAILSVKMSLGFRFTTLDLARFEEIIYELPQRAILIGKTKAIELIVDCQGKDESEN